MVPAATIHAACRATIQTIATRGRRAGVLEIRELILRVQLGEPDRRIARELQVSRKTVSKSGVG
jgi:hypothetical protein